VHVAQHGVGVDWRRVSYGRAVACANVSVLCDVVCAVV
jgi:hypothetical protein